LIFSNIVSSRNFLSIPFCTFFLIWTISTITVTNAVVEGILVARVWAIYRTQRVVLAVAVFFYLGGICTLVGLTIINYMGETVAPVNDVSFLPGCHSTKVLPLIAGFWIAPLAVESVLFVLVVFRAFMWWKDKESAPPTLVLLARDSTVYFAVIFALMMANLLYFEYGPPSLVMIKPSNTAVCIAGSRILLNIRALAYPNHTTDMEMSITTLRFSPLKHRRTRPDVVVGTVTSVHLDTSRRIPGEERAEDDGTQPRME